MARAKRVFLIVLDSMGIGEMPDAARWGDEGSHTVKACWDTGELRVPNLQKLGLFNIEGIGCGEGVASPLAAFGRMQEASAGKDTTIGHWEIAGIISPRPLPTYPDGFPPGVIAEFERRTGRKTLCNRPYSGTQVLLDYGREQVETGALIVYTSADSVFQIAAHEEIVPVEELYEHCRTARGLLTGEHGVGRVIARPFVGTYPDYRRTANRHDFSLEPPANTFLNDLQRAGLATIGVGKIYDIFAGNGISSAQRTVDNDDGMQKTLAHAREEWNGLCFVNLVDFDMVYGHRNNVAGYTEALNHVDGQLGELMTLLRQDDVLMITADHGCDPATPSTDHSREYTPLLIYGRGVRPGVDLHTRPTFADIGKTAADLLGVRANTSGESLAPLICG
ncbi:phosphopentomutase [Ligaoa zhengdingensis]|uniref:phosphopentomutase n=1 Tax=Ligaoa zhengdingensis TaxID=2763658 RepID=UPI0031BB6F94